jgi:hypothetical protein
MIEQNLNLTKAFIKTLIKLKNMDKKAFIHSEIKQILEILTFVSNEDKASMIDAVKDLDLEGLVKILKTLYKVEREYLQFIEEDNRQTEKFITTLQLNHD